MNGMISSAFPTTKLISLGLKVCPSAFRHSGRKDVGTKMALLLQHQKRSRYTWFPSFKSRQEPMMVKVCSVYSVFCRPRVTATAPRGAYCSER